MRWLRGEDLLHLLMFGLGVVMGCALLTLTYLRVPHHEENFCKMFCIETSGTIACERMFGR